MRASIVIPAKNEERYLPLLLRSIREQTFQDFDIILADADSTDQTAAIAKTFGVKVVKGGLPGPGRNAGAREAKGDLLIFFDADVLLPAPTFLEDCLAEMSRRDLDVATCRVEAYKGTLVDEAMHGAYNAYTILTEKVLPHAPGFCLFALRSAHESIGGFDEDVVFAEDMDYVRRAVKTGCSFGILRAHKIAVSVRRLEKEGRGKLAAKYIYSELRILARGPFKKKIPFTYEFKHDKKNGEES